MGEKQSVSSPTDSVLRCGKKAEPQRRATSRNDSVCRAQTTQRPAFTCSKPHSRRLAQSDSGLVVWPWPLQLAPSGGAIPGFQGLTVLSHSLSLCRVSAGTYSDPFDGAPGSTDESCVRDLLSESDKTALKDMNTVSNMLSEESKKLK